MNSTQFKKRFADILARVDQRNWDTIPEIEQLIEDPSFDVTTRCYLRSLRGFALLRSGRKKEAEESLQSLLPFAAREGLHGVVTQCHRLLSECADASGDQLGNRQHCLQALAASRHCEDPVLQFACELGIANVIGEWGRPDHAAMLVQRLYEESDWSQVETRRFHDSTRAILAWWLSRSGAPQDALVHLNALATGSESPYRRHVATVGMAFARNALGEALDIEHLEALLSVSLENGWSVSAAEIHLLLSHQAADDSAFAKTNISLAVGLLEKCTVDMRLLVLERAAECAAARGDSETLASIGEIQVAQLETIMQAEAIAPLVCPRSGELLIR